MTQLKDALFKGNIEAFWDHQNRMRALKPQASIERAMGRLARRERDLHEATGDALAILGKAHGAIMRERQGLESFPPTFGKRQHPERKQKQQQRGRSRKVA